MERIRNILVLLRARLWIVPGLICAGGMGLAFLMLWPGSFWSTFSSSNFWWLYSGDPGSARNLLGALLSGTMTMTSLVVSLTFVTLTLAASQLGPRLIVNFISDRQIQAVLGLFLATILYIIIVLRTVGDTLGAGGVPHMAITVASVLTVACMFALLFYVHKISRAIIADTVIENVSHDLQGAIRDFLPEDSGEDLRPVNANLPAARATIGMERFGYVQVIDYPALVRWAAENHAVVRINIRAGDFVLRGGRHIDIFSGQDVDEDKLDDLREPIVIGAERSPAQDLEYSIRQLVEVALRALSPGINDPFTAAAGIDRLGSALELILKRTPLPTILFDEDSHMRVVAARPDASGLANVCFSQIRNAASTNPAVLTYMANTLAKLAESCVSHDAKEVLRQQLQHLEETARAAGATPTDRADLLARIHRAQAICEGRAQDGEARDDDQDALGAKRLSSTA